MIYFRVKPYWLYNILTVYPWKYWTLTWIKKHGHPLYKKIPKDSFK